MTVVHPYEKICQMGLSRKTCLRVDSTAMFHPIIRAFSYGKLHFMFIFNRFKYFFKVFKDATNIETYAE